MACLHCSQNLLYTQDMATLSDVKSEFLSVSKIAGIATAIFLVIFFVIQIFSFIKTSSTRNQPTVSFGKLTKVEFPNGITNKYTYTIDTISGALPATPQQVKIYKMISGEPDLLAVQKTSEKVAALGFNGNPIQISDVLYRWNTTTTFSKSLTVNVVNPQFNLTSDFFNDKEILAAVRLPNEEEAIATSKNFIDTLGFLPDNVDDAATKTKLLKIQNGAVSEATSISNAQLISIYFFQKKDEIPFVYPIGGLSSINLTVGSSKTGSEIVDARFFSQKISDTFGTYPLISIQDAFTKLKNGQAYISSYNGNGTNIYIKKVYLAYYIEGKEQNYLMPVIVFEGNDNFFAYVSAVRDEWINN